MEEDIHSVSPAHLRILEAALFLHRFKESCGSPTIPDQYLEWIAYADACVMSLISVEEMVSPKHKAQLHASDVFRLVKALRNLTIHESVWPAPKQRKGARATVSRIININVGVNKWVEPQLSIPGVRRALSRRLKNRPSEGKTVEGARRWLRKRSRSGASNIPLNEVFDEALAEVASICEIALTTSLPNN